jgi:hypothetical protein
VAQLTVDGRVAVSKIPPLDRAVREIEVILRVGALKAIELPNLSATE